MFDWLFVGAVDQHVSPLLAVFAAEEHAGPVHHAHREGDKGQGGALLLQSARVRRVEEQHPQLETVQRQVLQRLHCYH